MDSHVEASLPVRLVPRRGQAVFRLVFMVIWCGFLVFWAFAFLPDFISTNGPLSLRGLTVEHLILLVPVLMFCVGIFGVVRSIMAALPGSPYVYLEFAQDSLTWRDFSAERKIAWSEIRQFSLFQEKSGKSHKWVLRADGVSADRGIETLLKIELGKFLSAFGGKSEAEHVAAWFNGLLTVVNAGRLPATLRFPESLAYGRVQRHGKPRSGSTVATSSRRKSVIER